MYEWIKLSHLAAGVVWLGGMTVMLAAVRPVATAQLPPPLRLPFMAQVMGRFFVCVWASIAVLCVSGTWMLSVSNMALAPKGWHAMAGLGLLMCLNFAHLWFAPYRRLRAAVAARDWPAASKAMASIHPLVALNFGLGWLAVAAAALWR